MIRIDYYSDVLCVWAYLAQIKLDELRSRHGDRTELDYRCIPVFGTVQAKMEAGWAERGGIDGYAKHVREIVDRFDHVELSPDAWTKTVPTTSLGAHALLKAAALLLDENAAEADSIAVEKSRPPLEQLAWLLRLAFFRDGRDIACLDVQLDVASGAGFPPDGLKQRLSDGSALARLHEDHDLAVQRHVAGSPTFILNESRQRLYGNVGYRILEANVEELLRDNSDRASWC